MPPRTSKTNMRENAQQETTELQIHIESGEKYRPYTSVSRIESIDAKKKSTMDPRLYALAKGGVPPEQLGVFSIEMSQPGFESSSPTYSDVQPEDCELESKYHILMEENAKEHVIQPMKVEWPIWIADGHTTGTFSTIEASNLALNSENMVIGADVQMLGSSSPQCDVIQDWYSYVEVIPKAADEMFLDYHSCILPGFTDGTQPISPFGTPVLYKDHGGEVCLTDSFASCPADSDYSFLDTQHGLPSPVQDELLTPQDSPPFLPVSNYVDTSYSVGDLKTGCSDQSLYHLPQWEVLQNNTSCWDPSVPASEF